MMRVVRTLFWLVPILAAIVAISLVASRPARIKTIRPARTVISETIAASGEVRGQMETSVGANVGGRVAAVLVRSGDRVQAGQVVARMADDVLRAEVTQAQEEWRVAQAAVAQADGAVRSAQAQVALAARKPLDADVVRTRAEAAQNTAVAEAKVVAARQRLAELARGATAEQRQQVAAQTEQAQLALEKAERDLERQKRLYRAGAIAQIALDDAETARDTARKTLDNVRARQREVEVGTRPEQVAQAQADLRAAEATLEGATAMGRAQVEAILALPRLEDVRVAQAKLSEAQRDRAAARAKMQQARIALDVARQRLAETLVTAPFDGAITDVVTEAGGITGPSQPVVKLVRVSRPEIRVAIDEDNLGRLKVGQRAIVTAEAFPSQQITAHVREIGAAVQSDKGQIEVKLTPEQTPSWLRPGQTLAVNLIVSRGAPGLTLPVSALTTAGNVPQVLVVEGGRVVQKRIETGAAGPAGVVIRGGLTADAEVIPDPHEGTPGQRVEATGK
jgi:HlyD family secretion protein